MEIIRIDPKLYKIVPKTYLFIYLNQTCYIFVNLTCYIYVMVI